MSKYKCLKFQNGDILSAEQLAVLTNDQNEYIFNFFKNNIKNYYGIINLSYDSLLLKEGIVRIKEFQGIFPDGTFINFTGEYNVQQDIKTLTGELYLYVARELQEEITHIEGNISQIMIRKSNPMIKISQRKTNNSLKFLNLQKDLTDNLFLSPLEIGTRLLLRKNHQIFNKIEEILTILLNKKIFLTNRQEKNFLNQFKLFQYTQAINELEICRHNKQLPQDIYEHLLKVISLLELETIHKPYNHENNTQLIDELSQEILTKLSKNFKRIHPIITENAINISLQKNTKEIYMSIYNKSALSWIKNANIAFEKNFTKVCINQQKGLERIIEEKSKELWVKINLPEKKGEKLLISKPNSAINYKIFTVLHS